MNNGRGCAGSRPEWASQTRLHLRRLRVLGMAGVLAAVPMVTGLPQVSFQEKAHPVTSQVRQVGFVKASVTSMRAAGEGTSSARGASRSPDLITSAVSAAVIPVQEVTSPVTVVGVTWPKGAVSEDDKFQIRTLTGKAWGQWQTLDGDEADGPDPKEAATAASVATGGTSPYVVTGASKFEVRTLTTDPTAPTAATVSVVDPGASNADSNRPAAGAAAAAIPSMTIHTRATWGANEALRKAPPSYGQVKVGFVHHTVSSNTYTASQVPAMIRGIYAYHVQAQGWSDIGYNFLVDRFGRTWEGRFGGIGRAVVGAQTANYNGVSTGVSAIGNFEVAAVPSATTAAVKRILAWKLAVSRVPATGTVVANGKSFQRISGHRDGFQTSCPGRYLYAKVPEIRAGAAYLMQAPAPRPAPAPAPRPAPTPAPTPAPKAPSPSAAATRYTPYKGVGLRQGSRGTPVVVLQRTLKLSADGAFGPKTRAAVVAFQTRQRMVANGVVGRTVWDRLERLDYPLIAYRRVVLRQGSRGVPVVVVQRVMRLTADGSFGPKTGSAVRAVQARTGIAQTGVVSGWTWVAIENQMRR